MYMEVMVLLYSQTDPTTKMVDRGGGSANATGPCFGDALAGRSKNKKNQTFTKWRCYQLSIASQERFRRPWHLGVGQEETVELYETSEAPKVSLR